MNTHAPVRALLAAAVLAAGIGTATAAFADDGTPPSGGPRASAPTVAPTPTRPGQQSAPTSVEHQRGVVIEAHGQHAGSPVAVYLYENSLYGGSVQVVLDAEQDLVGSVEQQAPFIVDGVLDVTVDVRGRSVVLSGTVADTGERVRDVDATQDAGEQIVTKGTRTQLLTDLSLTVDGVTVPLEAAPAFAYDLEVRRVTLYGS
jgi:hypothetical protein